MKYFVIYFVPKYGVVGDLNCRIELTCPATPLPQTFSGQEAHEGMLLACKSSSYEFLTRARGPDMAPPTK